MPAVRSAIRTVDANRRIVQMRTLQDMLDRASADMAFTMVLLAIAATVALRTRDSGVHPHQAGNAMNALVVGGVAVSALARTDGGRASTAACETHSTR